MATLYCSSCGTKMEYFSAKPNFCSSCGKSVNAAFASVSKSAVVKKTKLIEVEVDEESEESSSGDFSGGISVPKIGVDIVVGNIEKSSVSFEELAKQKPLGMTIERKTFDSSKPLLQQMREMSKPANLGDLSSQSDE